MAKRVKKTVSKPAKAEKKAVEKKAAEKPKYKVAPLSAGFSVLSLVGIIISAFLIPRKPTWGVAFLVVFLAMFIASLRSMRYGPLGKI